MLVFFASLVLSSACPELGRQATHESVSVEANEMATRFEALWGDPQCLNEEIEALRHGNPEWDFMHRTFLVLALANMALADCEFRHRGLELMDRVILDTLEKDKTEGPFHFLMGYARHGQWVANPVRSLFVDGEIALMLGARRMVQEKPEFAEEMARRLGVITAQMGASPYGFAESYPDECWLFCNSVALAATTMGDRLDGTDFSALRALWLKSVQQRLVDSNSGMLISAFTLQGLPASSAKGPEGSSIWLAAHMLQLVDPGLARQQYDLARRHLGRVLMGMGYSREWTPGSSMEEDVDSGFHVMDASSSASGLAILAAKAFEDAAFHAALLRSLQVAGSPKRANGQRWYEASNLVGDAVILYGLVNGPLWSAVTGPDRCPNLR